MLTNVFKKAMQLALVNSSSRKSSNAFQVRGANGNTYYLTGIVSNNWPSANPTTTLRIATSTSSGIWIGSGTTSPTAEDYTLEARITSGVSGSCSISDDFFDNDGNPILKMVVTLSNNGSADITVSEIGFFQQLNAATSISSSGTAQVFMIDRTILNEPVTIPAGESVAITYTLKTVIV